LIGFDKLIIKNNYGRNGGHKGSDHCNVFLQMHNKVSMRKYLTLYDLAIAYYKLKSHKWDDYYEEFGWATTVIHKGTIEVSLVFDHS